MNNRTFSRPPKHINIPLFIPHEGCPNACIFCNQHSITGKNGSADRDIVPEIEAALTTYTGLPENAEIAFFGGSFTGLDRALMTRLLETAYAYVQSGRVGGIRLSTRPDYIDAERLTLLKQYGVRDIELGLQSMCDNVLSASKRGHTAAVAETACALIKQYGFTLTGQMMLGLPASALADELYTARKIVAMGCDYARIYPTVVFEHTELCTLAKSGAYMPLTVEEAVFRGAAVYKEFVESDVKILRIGLQATESLGAGSDVYGGANHSALGERIVGEYYFQKMLADFDRLKSLFSDTPGILEIRCAPGEESKVAGQQKHNKMRLCALLATEAPHFRGIKIIADRAVAPNKLAYGIRPLPHSGKNPPFKKKDGNKTCT